MTSVEGDRTPVEQQAVIGRYAGPDSDQHVEVVLKNFPLQVFAEARQRHDDLMREFALLAMRPPSDGARPLPHRLLELVDILGRRYGGSADRSDKGRDEAVERGELAMDLRYVVPVSIGPAMEQLARLMAEADEFCASEDLLTLAPDELTVHFREWFCQEFIDQAAGRPPTAWDGALLPAGSEHG
ncbi:MAG: hypothetical protein QOD91_1675 [Frankiales bacterium]|nr:hypothetical protein [Frankiales bacterium]